MPIRKDWSSATEEHVSEHVPERGGVYELKSFGETVYVGAAGDLRAALLEHVTDRSPNYYRYETEGLMATPRALAEYHLGQFREGHGRDPSWNRAGEG